MMCQGEVYLGGGSGGVFRVGDQGADHHDPDELLVLMTALCSTITSLLVYRKQIR